MLCVFNAKNTKMEIGEGIDISEIIKMNISKKIVLAFVLFACCLIFISCSRLNKFYDYKPITYQYDNGEVGAKLIGTDISSNKETVRSSPYELFIWFEANSKTTGTVLITSIELYNIDDISIVFKNENVLKESFKDNSFGTSSAYFSIKQLDLKYVQYKLVITCQIASEDFVTTEKIEVYFKKDYKEYKSNDILDMIMSA
ncbi:MAG: hypothetical protein U9Q67_03590 [Patescibacteria group bacterium]|nr:hypothetical protein [Patescibacteria group bacterium]